MQISYTTFNLKDFPENEMKKLGIRAVQPDQFISTLIEINPINVLKAFNNQVKNLRYPKMRPEEVLQRLERCNLKTTSNKLRKIL
jgi:predicted RNA-binding protein with EMAP domain